MKPHQLRDIVCGVVRKRPDPNNWTEYPNVWGEVEWHVHHCDWFRIYDIIEAIRTCLATEMRRGSKESVLKVAIFDEEVNVAFRELGIGWQLKDGLIQARGDDSFEAVVNEAKDVLKANRKVTAQNELEESLRDISRRPLPDVTGAIHHAVAALECVAKEVAGEPKATLGQILARHGAIVPKPLDQAVEKIWGFASDRARHVREGQSLAREEAHLVVGLAAVLVNYLAHKASCSME
jgi:hypothetical protein